MAESEIDVQNKVASHYEEKRYERPYSLAYHTWWVEKMLEQVTLQSPILDNGCGTGFLARFLEGFEVIGVDLSPKMLEYAKPRYSRVVLGDAEDLPFENESFLTIINRAILHHLKDPHKGVAEIHRILKPGGHVVFSETLNSLMSRVPRLIAQKEGGHFSKDHKNFYENEIEEIISSQFIIEKKYYFGYVAYPLLGFPDVLDVYRHVPFKKVMTPFLIQVDEAIAHIPLINRQAWGIMHFARKQ